MKIALINHGCAKNLVDSELMLGILAEKGYNITLDDKEADILIINTCSFIHDAEKESVQSIMNAIQENKKIIVTGCLPQKYKKELQELLPEIKAFLGTTQYHKIADVIENIEKETFYEVEENPTYKYDENIERQQITVGSSSYIKIADGCNFKCGYCIIPQLRGSIQSRKIEDIVKEANYLADKGVSEIVLIAQDTTSYGVDLYKKPMLAKLLQELNKIKKINWIRIMYTYPSMITDELIDVIAKSEKVVKYIDIPLQHSHPEILKLMNRPVFDYEELINKLRTKIPDIAIRTTFITGYPQENEKHFEHLKKFIQKMKFDKVGIFTYSKEKNTYAYNLKPQIKASIKKQRKNELMKIQQKISLEINKKLIGKQIDCIIEAILQDGKVIARSYKDAPEVDGLVYIDTKELLTPGDIEKVTIVDCNEYDLFGVI